MDFDVAFILVAATAVTGVIWGIDAALFASRRKAAADADTSPEPLVVEYARSFFPVLLIVLLLRSFIVEPFRIPSGSMMPTLLVGDFILVNKFSYGVRWPVLNSKFLDTGEPERGDVAVFRYPRRPELDYIKRIVGLPGDEIIYEDKLLTVNGKPVELSPIARYQTPSGEVSRDAIVFTEKVGDDDYTIMLTASQSDGREGRWVVPDGQYFVMGDNRDNSNDGRYWGYVPEDHLVGRAFMIWMNWDWGGEGILWSRIGSFIE